MRAVAERPLPLPMPMHMHMPMHMPMQVPMHMPMHHTHVAFARLAHEAFDEPLVPAGLGLLDQPLHVAVVALPRLFHDGAMLRRVSSRVGWSASEQQGGLVC